MAESMLFKGQPLRRAQLRSWMNRRLRQSRDAGERAALAEALSSRDAFDDVFSGLDQRYDDEVHALADEPGAPNTGRPIMDFLQWLLDNQEGIIAFIKAIMGLFGGLAVEGTTAVATDVPSSGARRAKKK